jgi:hypothetical protein
MEAEEITRRAFITIKIQHSGVHKIARLYNQMF